MIHGKKPTKTFSISLPTNVFDQIDGIAKERNASRKSVILEMVVNQLGVGSNPVTSEDVDSLKSIINDLKKQLDEKQSNLTQALENVDQAQKLHAHDKNQLEKYQDALFEATKPKQLFQRIKSIFVPDQLITTQSDN
jgi:flagellar biosynthesis chaperone FliJ|tara:strand:- start:277 stop:687 length:411 start_codon:yes stop_codon:yes gene_type:complete